jgi:hypothetical protein
MQPQNKTTNTRGMVLLSTMYGCLVYPVAFVLTLTILALLLEESYTLDLGYLMGTIMLIVGFFGRYALLMSLLVGLLIGLFIEFKRTSSLWRAAGGGALIGFIVAMLVGSLVLGPTVFSAPLGISLSSASTLAGMLSALAVGLAVRYMR